MIAPTLPGWMSGAIRGAKPVALPVGAAAVGLTAGYQLAFHESNQGDFMHPTEWGLGAVKATVLAGIPAVALAVGGPVLARRAGLEVARTTREAAKAVELGGTLTKAQVLERSRAGLAAIEVAAGKSQRMGEIALPVGIAGVGGVVGTGWALDVTQSRLDKPDLHVTVDQNITMRDETVTSRATREAQDAGEAAHGVLDTVGGFVSGLFN